MTMQFALDGEWLALTHKEATGDRREWARTAVQRLNVLGADLGTLGPLAEHLEAVAELCGQANGIGHLLLAPQGLLPVRAAVLLDSFTGPEDEEGFRDQCSVLMPPLSWLVDPVNVATLESAAGPVTRLHVRTADPEADDAPVQDDFYWLWWFAKIPATYMATTSFSDVTDTALFLDTVEDLLLSGRRADDKMASPANVPEGDYVGA